MKKRSKIFSDNLLVLLLNLLVAFGILLAVYFDCGTVDSHCCAAALATALYFCLVASPLAVCRFGNAHILSTLSVALVSGVSVLLPGAWIWAVVVLLLCVYDLWVVRSSWMLTLLNLFFTAFAAAVSYGLFELIFWLVSLLRS